MKHSLIHDSERLQISIFVSIKKMSFPFNKYWHFKLALYAAERCFSFLELLNFVSTNAVSILPRD